MSLQIIGLATCLLLVALLRPLLPADRGKQHRDRLEDRA